MGDRLRLLLEEARTWLDGLAVRERRLVQGAGAISLVLLLWLGIYEPLTDSLARLDRDLRIAGRDATAIAELAQRHAVLEAEVGKLQKKAGKGTAHSLFAQLESLTVPVVGREHISSMNPTTRDLDDGFRQEAIDMRLEGISSHRLIRLLHAIEIRQAGMKVDRTSFKRQYKDPTLLDATIVVTRLQPR